VRSYVLHTERLRLRELDLADAPFVLELLTDPLWLRFIGDRGVHDIASACRYLTTGPLDMYQRLGFGLWLVERRSDAASIGMCGLLKRDTLEQPDLGFALLAQWRGQRYAREAAAATLTHAHTQLAMPRVLAITSPDNTASADVLRDIGMRFERCVRLKGEERETAVFASG
jgi:ribosomal-protein-alanine N-acetyltransferase